MPELPDITIYLEALEARVFGRALEDLRLASPFFVRTTRPPARQAIGRELRALRRVGKRIALGFEGELWLVIHLMIAGRLHWAKRGAKPPGNRGLAALDFANGTLLVTEASSHKRASLHAVEGADALAALDPGGLEVLACDLAAFRARLLGANHTLKRALTDPRLFSGIGNAYSDEILHAARLSPIALTQKLGEAEIARLFEAAVSTLDDWTARLRASAGGEFPERVTAFRDDMAVHGRFRLPCPACGSAVQRIRYASNETNYCPRCQTGGRVLADRSLSKLLKKDWPRTVEELEQRALPAFGKPPGARE